MWLPDTPQDHDDRMIEVGRSEAKDRITELEAALREIELRTRAYKGDFEGYPLAAGVHEVASRALASQQ